MSAFLVNADLIVMLASEIMGHHSAPGETFSYWNGETLVRVERTDYAKAVELANMLWTENAKSVAWRYNDDSEMTVYTPIRVSDVVSGNHLMHRPKPVEILKALDCLEYQSCEHPGWKDSEAKRVIDAIRRRVIRRIAGYDDAQWGYTYPERAY